MTSIPKAAYLKLKFRLTADLRLARKSVSCGREPSLAYSFSALRPRPQPDSNSSTKASGARTD